MNEDENEGISINIGIGVGIWLAIWLFTVGYVKLTGIKIFYAFFIWAYYLGQYLK